MAGSPSAAEISLKQLQKEVDILKRHLHIVNNQHVAIPLTIRDFKLDAENIQLSEPFYSHPCGYKLCLRTVVSRNREKPGSLDFAAHVCLMDGEFDQELDWPVKARVTIQIQNQNGDSDHIKRGKQISWQYKSKGDPLPIPVMTDVDVAMLKGGGSGEGAIRYVVRDTLHLSVKYMAL